MAITNLSLENLQKLQGFKQAWETGDSAAKAAASKGATDLRKSLGIASDTLSLGDVNELIRLKQTEQAKAQPIAAQPTAPVQTVDTQSLINQLAEAQKQKNIASLGQAYQTSLGTLAEEEKQIAPQYEAQRTQAKIQNQMQMKAFENWLANQGLSASGAAPQGAISQTVALQNTLGSSQLAQRKALEDVARRRTQLGTDYQFGLASAEADVNISAMQNALNQANQDAQLALQKRSMDLQEQGMNADEAYRQATFEYQKIQDKQAFDYAAQQNAINQAMNEAALTGMYQGQQTLQGQAAQADLITQALQQQILQGQVNTLPYETQLLAQQVKAGEIDIETAKARLAALKSGGSSGGTKNSLDNSTKTLDSVSEITSYNNLKANLQQGRAWNKDGLNYIANNFDALATQYGVNAVNKLYQDLNTELSTPKEQEKVEFTSDQMIGAVIDSYTNDGMSNKEALDDLKKYASTYIAEMGRPAYNYLVGLYTEE